MEENQYQSFFNEEDLCKQCGKKYIERTENQESVLCKGCREEMIKLKVPPVIYAAMAVVLILVMVAVYFFIPVLKDYAIYENAGRKAADGHPAVALTELVELNEKYPDSKKIAIRSADLGMEYSFYDYAAYAMDTHLAGREVSDTEYIRLTGYQEQLDQYYNTVDLLDDIAATFSEAAGAEGENMEKAVTEFRNSIIEYTEDSQYDQALLYYYAGYYSNDMSERIFWFEKCMEKEPKYYSAEIDLANTYRRQGDTVKARTLLDHAYSINKDDALVMRAYATLEMVDGSTEKALEYARTAYQWYAEGEYVADTYIVALYANGMTEEAHAVKEEWEAKDYYFDEDMHELLAGERTVYDYYVGE